MSLLLRVRLRAQKRVFSPKYLNFYSTKTSDIAQDTVKSTKFETQKSSQSSTGSSQRTKKQTASSINWPKPREIPYQAKVANVVNLVGYVVTPVRSEIGFDGKHLAAIVISQKISDRKDSLSIPVVFDGDLAHTVTHHVKQNDRVLVSGRLSVDPLKLSLGDSFGKLHVVAENLNFVEGIQRNTSPKKVQVSFPGVEIDKHKPGHEKIELYEKDGKVENIQQPNQQLKETLEPATSNGSFGVKNNSTSGSWVESGKSGYRKDEELWRDIVKNPLLWWDYRGHKSNALVKDKHPDFKEKYTGEPLWANRAPNWVLTELEKLEFDVKVMRVQGDENLGDKKSGSNKRENLWKNLVENPSKWWDNRVDKRNPKAPDFKHKETGEGVWLNQLPAWALSRLPRTEDGHNAGKGVANPLAS